MMHRQADLYGTPWAEMEYLLSLDLYFRLDESPRHPSVPVIKDLADLLGRTAASVCMRLENFASLDPKQEERRGLSNVSPVCVEVFSKWQDKQDHLSSCVEVLRRQLEERRTNRTLFDDKRVVQAFGHYELLDSIGQGGFGRVYSCLDTKKDSLAALKVIQTNLINEPESIHRFKREILALKAVDHHNVIELYEDNLGTEQQQPAFAMELADQNLGEYLRDLAKDKVEKPAIGVREAIKIVRSISEACNALHSNEPRIIHRDINPSNILRIGDRWVLADFGLAKFLRTTQLTTSFGTATDQKWGTAFYAAPEQYKDLKRTDERTDVYALGVLVWEVFTSGWPPPRDQEGRTGLPPGIEAVYLKAVSEGPEDRFQSVPEFLADFERHVRVLDI